MVCPIRGPVHVGRYNAGRYKVRLRVSHIETRHAKEIKDLITLPPGANKYETIKKTLIQRLSVSQEQQIRQLLEHEEIGDRKPSQFLRHLQNLAGVTVPESLLRTLWMGILPPQLQAILTTRSADNLNEVADQADRFHEVTCRTIAVAGIQPNPEKQTLEQKIEALSKQVADLNLRLARPRKKGEEQRRARSRSRSAKRTQEDNICFYHRRFKEKAQKCTQPCEYKKPKEN